MTNIIAILEDNAERRQAMLERLQDRFPFRVEFFVTASQVVQWLEEHFQEVRVLSLDHDLESDPLHPQQHPGTGREVAEYLAKQPALFPIIIHSTNVPASIGMLELLSSGNWSVERVTPYDDLTWISREWFWAMRQAILNPPHVPLVTPANAVSSAVT